MAQLHKEITATSPDAATVASRHRLAQWLWQPRERETVLLTVVAYLAIVHNLSLWQHASATLGLEGVRALFGLVAVGMALVTILTVVLGLLTPGRLFRPVLALLIVAASLCSFYMDAYGTVFDRGMIASVLETNPGEAVDLMTPGVVSWVLISGIVPALWVLRVPLKQRRILRGALQRTGLIAMLVLLLLAVVLPQYRTLSFWGRQHRDVRMLVNPTFPLYALYRETKSRFGEGAGQTAVALLGMDARAAYAGAVHQPLRVIFVVGETVRADHLQLNGYTRPTTPMLAARADLLSFVNVTSCATYTAASVPCMFSRLNADHFQRKEARAQENVLDVLQHAGIEVSWVENNDKCHGVCSRVPSVTIAQDANGAHCKPPACLDTSLIAYLPDAPPRHDELLVLHTVGSHGPAYFHRYPDSMRYFTPDCRREDVQNCTQQEVVNAYDNTVRYLDQFLNTVIEHEAATGANSIVLYVSDHGESLGENGTYLHGLPNVLAPEAQRHVPMLVWTSPAEQETGFLSHGCLQQHMADPLSHDNIFDTLLGLFSIQSDVYEAGQDFTWPCRG